VALLASGAEPRNIAAITFTDFAAGELRVRITRFLDDLLAGTIPRDLKAAFPNGLTPLQRAALEASSDRMDELTCTTIHGFCHALLCSYAIEADIDPGAEVLDRNQMEVAFRSVFENWLNRRLGKAARANDPIVFMAQATPREAVKTPMDLGQFRQRHRSAYPVQSDLDTNADRDFVKAVHDFRAWFDGTPRPDVAALDVNELEELAEFYDGAFQPLSGFQRLWELAHPKRIEAMRWQSLELKEYRRPEVWRFSAGKEEGELLCVEAARHYERCAETLSRLLGRIATALVAEFCGEIDDLLASYASYKQNAAVLDFDDLLLACRNLLRNREEVRLEIAERYKRILIDEFQDTDPIQAEILFLIASEPGASPSWRQRALRPGALFMVGDPKQAIYRFRGADLATYMEAREAIERQFPGNILHVTSNFRSRQEILEHVNRCFRDRLSQQGTAYVPLDKTLGPAEHILPCVARLSVPVAERARLHEKRDAEAQAVADLCRRLIGNITVRRSDGSAAPLAPGDIALLTPVRTDVWRYEHALEEAGLPFISKAGRNLFRRQETQDLIAIIRVLANSRDTLALGALLRGPLVGLTDRELLDITAALPESERDAEGFLRLTVRAPPGSIAHPVARQVLTVLGDLQRRPRGTTPFRLVSEALERLRVRPILAQRSADQAARCLANIELLMDRVRAYAVRGLQRLADDLTADWEDNTAYDEAHVDGILHAINIVTIHVSKGLEWPLVIPINMGSRLRSHDPFIHRRRDDSLHWVLGDVVPPAMADAIGQEQKEVLEERERLLYVACTRAIDLLVLPHLAAMPSQSWAQLLDLRYVDLPELETHQFRPQAISRVPLAENSQTPEKFGDEREQVTQSSEPIPWLRPSDADADRPAPDTIASEQVEPLPAGQAIVAGSAVRGLVLHKLMEELLNREIREEADVVAQRAAELLRQLASGSGSADPTEMAATALRTIALPAINDRRDNLVPEVPVYASLENETIHVAGRCDAIAYSSGSPEIIFDWKSDVAPTATEQSSYKSQVLVYASATGAARGAVVYMSLGVIDWIDRART
jgi:CRISPR-associated exonuclease Cas4